MHPETLGLEIENKRLTLLDVLQVVYAVSPGATYYDPDGIQLLADNQLSAQVFMITVCFASQHQLAEILQSY